MVRLLFSLFLVCGVCASVMAQDTALPVAAVESALTDVGNSADTNAVTENVLVTDDQNANVTKVNEGTADNAAVPVQEEVPVVPAIPEN